MVQTCAPSSAEYILVCWVVVTEKLGFVRNAGKRKAAHDSEREFVVVFLGLEI